MYETFCSSCVQKSLSFSSFLLCMDQETCLDIFIACGIQRISTTGLNESCCIQAFWKPTSSPSSLIDLMNSSLSVVENWLRNPVISAGVGDFAMAMKVVSLSLVVAAWACGFWSRQFYTRCPYLPHSKHRPALLHFSFSASVVALHVTTDVSIASGSLGKRRGQRACPVGQFPWFLCQKKPLGLFGHCCQLFVPP